MVVPSNLPPELDSPVNQAVLAYLGQSSCHSDIGDPFAAAARAVGLGVYCWNRASCGYLLACRTGQVVAFARGMHGISALVAPKWQDHWIAQGAEAIAALPGWLHFPLYGPQHFERELGSILNLAHFHQS